MYIGHPKHLLMLKIFEGNGDQSKETETETSGIKKTLLN